MNIRKRDIGIVLGAVPLCAALWRGFSDTEPGAYVLLGLAYGFFAGQMAVWRLGGEKPWKYSLMATFFLTCLGIITMLLFKYAQLDPLYPLATTLAYILLLQVLLLGVHRWIFSVPYSMHLHFQKRYLFYCVGLLALLFATVTMDQGDPFGPHFQLKVMVWVLLALLILNWFLGQWRMVKTLESANAQAELVHLKSQIQPHFLFNTLNNLYGLAREKSDLTADMILRLSELLRYGLYQANQERVPLSKEIEYLCHYIALQKLRYANEIEITTSFNAGPDNPKVSPLTLIPLLENAFKHGADKMAEGAAIHVELAVEEGVLRFAVENKINPNGPDHTPGIGLENLKKRLELVYPDRHSFAFTCRASRARAELSIRL